MITFTDASNKYIYGELIELSRGSYQIIMRLISMKDIFN